MPTYQDLFMRDLFGDDGSGPMDGYIAASPDIIPYGIDPLNTASTRYGPPQIDLPLSNNTNNYIYVRATNNAAHAASGRIYVYSILATLLSNVDAWRNNLLQNSNTYSYARLVDVPAGQPAFADQPFVWNPQATEGQHFCLVARVETAANPNPLPASFTGWADFVRWVRTNPNVVWHNVGIVNKLPPQGYLNNLQFHNVNNAPTYYTFTATYSGLPPGSVLRIHALPGPGFSGIDTRAMTINDGRGILSVSGAFPAYYHTLIQATCSFPGGPLTPPSGVSIALESFGHQQGMSLPENAWLLPFSHLPERLGVDGPSVGLVGGDMLVPINSYTVHFAPTAESLAEAAGPRKIFAT